MTTPQLVEDFIAGIERFRIERCNPDRPEGWIEDERAWHDAFYRAAELSNQAHDTLVPIVGKSMAGNLINEMMRLKSEWWRAQVVVLTNRGKESYEAVIRDMRNLFVDAGIQKLYAALREAAGGGPELDAQASTRSRSICLQDFLVKSCLRFRDKEGELSQEATQRAAFMALSEYDAEGARIDSELEPVARIKKTEPALLTLSLRERCLLEDIRDGRRGLPCGNELDSDQQQLRSALASNLLGSDTAPQVRTSGCSTPGGKVRRLVSGNKPRASDALLAEEPARWAGLSLWPMIAQRLATRFTVRWRSVEAETLDWAGDTFQAHLDDYCLSVVRGDLVPDEFSQEIARLDREGLAGELLGFTWASFANEAKALGLPRPEPVEIRSALDSTPVEEPKDLVTLSVASERCQASVPTLQRAISDGTLISYRPKGAKRNSKHFVSESSVANRWGRRQAALHTSSIKVPSSSINSPSR